MNHSFCPYCMNPVTPGQPCSACGLTAGSYTPLPHHLPPGTVLKERYLIGRVIGEGGFGITYIGCDLQLEVKLAIKEYFPVNKVSRNAAADLTVSRYSGTSKEEFERDLDRFLREARTMAKLSKQRAIVTIHDFFRDNQTAYIAMEYIDGTTFKDLTAQRGGRIPAWELLHLIEPLFSALQTMHDAGLIHRDISPENLMLEDGVVRLLDFGCARDVDSDRTLTISLKHSYAPVEQYQGKGQGPWTDVYALGATMYYCLTGKKPPQAMDRLLEDELVPPRKLGVDLSKSQERALLHAMSVRPRQRYQSMTEFHAALYEGMEARPKSPVLMTMGGAAAGAAGGAAAGAAAGTAAQVTAGTATGANTGTNAKAAAGTETTGSAADTDNLTKDGKTTYKAAQTDTPSAQVGSTSVQTKSTTVQPESTSAQARTNVADDGKSAVIGSYTADAGSKGGDTAGTSGAAAPGLHTAGTGGSAAAGEDTSGTTAASESASGSASEKINALLTWMKKNPRIAGIGAAAICLVLIVCIAIGTISGSRGSNAGSTVITDGEEGTEESAAADSEESAEGTADTEKPYTIEDGAAYVTDCEEDTLLEALADDDVESVVVSGDGWIYTTETLELHKSLTLKSGIYASSPVIVGEGGSMVMDNPGYDLCICGLLRTMDGGTVTVTSDGCVTDESGVLWLESWDDLTVEDGGTFTVGMGNAYGEGVINEGRSTWYYNVIDENALFADAVSVTNEEELREAAEDGSAVIIADDITLTEAFYQSVPVQIAEGVTVTALGEDQDQDEDGNIVPIDGDNREEAFNWTVDAETVLINHGTIKGDFYSNGEENDEPAAWVINDGTIDVSGWFSGMLINLENGTCNLMHGGLNQGGAVNLGTFTHTPRIGYDDMKMQSYFFNSGTLLIEGTEDTGSYAYLASGEMRNSASGIIEIGEAACFVNLTGIESQGQIILTTDTSSFLNQGTLDMANQYVGTLEVSAGSFQNTGLVRYTEDGYPYASEDANALCAYAEVWVSSASELQEALQDEGVSGITIDGDITWEDGDLLISEKEIIMYGSLTVTGGDLTVENGAFWCTGEISLDGGTFTAQGLGIVYAGGVSGCSELNIQASSHVILENGDLYDMAINLNVEDGENGDAALTTKYTLSLYDCTMTLATENCYICCWGFDCDEASTVSTVGDLEEQITNYD